MSNERYPDDHRLSQFLGGYFNEDWQTLFGTEEGAVRAFMAQEPLLVPSVVAHLDELIALGKAGQVDVEACLNNELRPCYNYEGQGITGLEWLERVRKVFDEFVPPPKAS